MISLPWRPIHVDGRADLPAILTSITLDETAVLAELAADAGNALDVGSAYGYSAVVLALAGAEVTTVDPHAGENPGTYQVLAGNLAAYGVADRVNVVVATSQQALPNLEAATFGLVFVDGGHDEATVEHDVGWARKLLRPGGILAAHDWDEATCPGVRAALERVLGPPPRLVDTLAVYEGLA
jgi:predicted O-methyltransferase YrrM